MSPPKFEDRLLVELRAVVAARPAPEAVISPPRRISPAPRPAPRRVSRARLTLAAGAPAAPPPGGLLGAGGGTPPPADALAKQAPRSGTPAIPPPPRRPS